MIGDLLAPLPLLALAGWGVVAAAIHELLRARRRLEAVARAEHELRGPVTVLLLAWSGCAASRPVAGTPGRLRSSWSGWRAGWPR